MQAVVSWFAPTDFVSWGVTGVTVTGKYLGQEKFSDEAQKELASPLYHIDQLDPSLAPAFYIQHGTADLLVPYSQGEAFNHALAQKLGPDKVPSVPIADVGHGAPKFYTDDNMDKVFAFLDKTLKS